MLVCSSDMTGKEWVVVCWTSSQLIIAANGSTERGKMKKTGSGANNSPIFFGGEGFDPIFFSVSVQISGGGVGVIDKQRNVFINFFLSRQFFRRCVDQSVSCCNYSPASNCWLVHRTHGARPTKLFLLVCRSKLVKLSLLIGEGSISLNSSAQEW